MTKKELLKAVSNLDDDLPVFFCCIAPIIGTIREVDVIEETTYRFFGKKIPCILLDVHHE